MLTSFSHHMAVVMKSHRPGPSDVADDSAKWLMVCEKSSHVYDHLKTFLLILKLKCLMIFSECLMICSKSLLTLCEGNHRWPAVSPHKRPVTRKHFHIMKSSSLVLLPHETLVHTYSVSNINLYFYKIHDFDHFSYQNGLLSRKYVLFWSNFIEFFSDVIYMIIKTV